MTDEKDMYEGSYDEDYDDNERIAKWEHASDKPSK